MAAKNSFIRKTMVRAFLTIQRRNATVRAFNKWVAMYEMDRFAAMDFEVLLRQTKREFLEHRRKPLEDEWVANREWYSNYGMRKGMHCKRMAK